MFGIVWYRAKAIGVMQEHFQYEPAIPGPHKEPFRRITRRVKDRGGNEYDAAVAFMLDLLRTLPGNDAKSREFTEHVRAVAAELEPKRKLGKAK